MLKSKLIADAAQSLREHAQALREASLMQYAMRLDTEAQVFEYAAQLQRHAEPTAGSIDSLVSRDMDGMSPEMYVQSERQ